MHKTLSWVGASLAGLGVILGALAAHKLKEIAPESVGTFQTGVQYQMYHAFALILAAIAFEKTGSKRIVQAGWLFFTGIVLFSGSLYALSLLKATGSVGLGGLGIITPIGGLFFIAGWLFFVLGVLRK